eukprot:13889014-Alexandrium_andersonii.AAC.1
MSASLVGSEMCIRDSMDGGVAFDPHSGRRVPSRTPRTHPDAHHTARCIRRSRAARLESGCAMERVLPRGCAGRQLLERAGARPRSSMD